MKAIDVNYKVNGQKIKTVEEVLESSDFKTINGENIVGSGDIKIDAGGGLVIETTTTTTVKGYAVPVLTAEQVVSIYNAVAAGKSVTVTDPTGNYHFDVDQADNVSGEISVEYKFFNTMYVTYTLDNNTVTVDGQLVGKISSLGGATGDILLGEGLSMEGNTLSASGGGSKLYEHCIEINNAWAIKQTYIIYNTSSEAFTNTKFANWLYDRGFRSSSNVLTGSGTANQVRISGNTITYYCLGYYAITQNSYREMTRSVEHNSILNSDNSITNSFSVTVSEMNSYQIKDTVTEL